MDTKHSGGFAGLIALMIAVMVIVYLAATQYMKFAQSKHQIIPAEEQAERADQGDTYTASDQSPIERAQGAKSTLEVRYQSLPQ
jgi:predicted lipid-binding transport protein (Tim44 family)